jgi:amphiphysin
MKHTDEKDRFYDCHDASPPGASIIAATNTGTAPAVTTSGATRSGGSKVAELASKLGGVSLGSRAPAPFSSSSSSLSFPPSPWDDSRSKIEYAVAMYDFTGQEAEDLSFRKGDRIQVLRRTPEANDWWTGSLNGRKGMFPGTYVCLSS